jgi:hypothetical protein
MRFESSPRPSKPTLHLPLLPAMVITHNPPQPAIPRARLSPNNHPRPPLKLHTQPPNNLTRHPRNRNSNLPHDFAERLGKSLGTVDNDCPECQGVSGVHRWMGG